MMMKICSSIAVFLCVCIVLVAGATDAPTSAPTINVTCITGSVPFPLDTTCPLGFYCPFLPLPPTYCSPTIECALLRTASEFCPQQGTTEPIVCPQGRLCETPASNVPCPKGYFCPTGTHKPRKCPELSLCPEGSFRARYFGSFLMCIIIDIALFGGWLAIKLHPSNKRQGPLFSFNTDFLYSIPVIGEKIPRKKPKPQPVVTRTTSSPILPPPSSPSSSGYSHNRPLPTPTPNMPLPPLPPTPQRHAVHPTMLPLPPIPGGAPPRPMSIYEMDQSEYQSRRSTTFRVQAAPPLPPRPTGPKPPPRPKAQTLKDSAGLTNSTSNLIAKPGMPISSSSSELRQPDGASEELGGTGGGVVSPGLVNGFKRAREGQDVSLKFEFENLSITLPTGLTILQGVSGSIRPGRVTAIMGPSGAGKTTFMNCMMGKVPRTGGTLKINNTELEMHTLQKVIGFVPQDDVMLSELTVRENIRHSALIRLPRDWTVEEKDEFVDAIIDALDLSHVAHTIVGDSTSRGISGGQKKRVNIGMELAAAPLAIFLDEPTSGLDSTAALKVAEILADMAQLGITVVSVIHQPRHEIFNIFHDILMIAPGGTTAYLGPQKSVMNHFVQMGFLVDPLINHADQLMDMLSGKGSRVDGMSYTVQDLVEYWRDHGEKKLMKDDSTNSDERALESIKQLGLNRGGPFYQQALYCHNRSLVQQFRLIPALILEVMVALQAGLLMGLATGYGNIENYRGVLVKPFTPLSTAPVEWAVPLHGLLFGMSIGLAGAPAGVKTFGEERLVYFRESAAGHNKLAYYLGKTVSVLYRQILCALHFSMIYHLMGAPIAPFHDLFSIVFLFFFNVYGLSAIVSMVVRRENASLLGVVVCLFAAVYNGFGPSLKTTHEWGLFWVWDLCYARWLSEALYTGEVLPYEGVYEVHNVSEPFFGYTLGRFGADCGIAFILGMAFRGGAYSLMLMTERNKQK